MINDRAEGCEAILWTDTTREATSKARTVTVGQPEINNAREDDLDIAGDLE